MKEFMRLRPGTDSKLFKQYQRKIHERALSVLAPCKDHGREHLACLIGRYVCEQHNEMTLICAGVKKRPKTREEQMDFSVRIATAGLLTGALCKLFEDPNTQWNEDTIIYYQLVNHFENMKAANSAALAVKL